MKSMPLFSADAAKVPAFWQRCAPTLPGPGIGGIGTPNRNPATVS
jgi:hypothetical protein